MISPQLPPALIIFTNNPEKGRVLTDVAQQLGDDAALTTYIELLDHTRAITKEFTGDKYLFYSDYLNWNDEWDIAMYRKRIQTGTDNLTRIREAFESVFEEGHISAMLIKANCLDLTLQVINDALMALEIHEIVIGPATDGSPYLLGLRRTKKSELTTLTEKLMVRDLTEHLDKESASYLLLPELHTITTASDITDKGHSII